jgi:anti-sigma factor RsiW
MSDRWTDRLSEYVDEDLAAPERADLEAHLRECHQCVAIVDDLRRIALQARSLPEEPADADLWPAIAARIGAAPRAIPIHRSESWSKRRISFSMAQLAAACLAVVAIGGSAVWYAATSGRHDAGELIPGSASFAVSGASTGVGTSATSAAVEELRRVLANGRDELDPATVRALEESLTVIEIAITQARRALDADPKNPYVRAHLDETMRRKVELLHRATMLASAPR